MKKTKLKEADRLKHKCPTCHAPPGQPCIDPKREATPRCHRTRGPGAYEEHLQKEIDRKVAREKATYGALFQEQADAEVKAPTVADLQWQKRFEAARSVDGKLLDKAMDGLEWIRLHWVGREMAKLIDPAKAAKLWAYGARVFAGKAQYLDDFLCGALTTLDKIRYDVELRFDPARAFKIGDIRPDGWVAIYNNDGRYLHDLDIWPPEGYVPPLTREEYKKRFPSIEEPDDGGLLDRILNLGAP